MFKDTSELAENKLLLLYILSKLESPTSNSHLTQVVLENNLINYFSLQQYISELIDNDFISDIKENNTHHLSLTEAGKSTLEFFINRIPSDKLNMLDGYMESYTSSTEVKFETFSSVIKEDSSYLVTLEIKKADDRIGVFNISLDSDDEVKLICDNWEKDGVSIYDTILEALKKS